MKTEIFVKLKKLRNEIDRREDELKKIKKDYEDVMQMCVDNMLEEGVDSVKIDGTLFTLNVLERPNIKKEVMNKFFNFLRRNGFSGLIVTKKVVNYQTLGKWYRDFIKENPKKKRILERYLDVFVDKKIVFRGLKNGNKMR